MKVFILFFFCLIISLNSFGQDFNWYYAWASNPLKLQKVVNLDTIPVFCNSKNYRILKIETQSYAKIVSITVDSDNAVKVYVLPKIKDYKNESILDVMIPFDSYQGKSQKEYYLFFEFSGTSPGYENIGINIVINNENYHFDKEIFVSDKNINLRKLNLNVWGYFDYSFLTDGQKDYMINDLVSHNVSLLVIRPKYLPEVLGNVNKGSLKDLKNYLDGALDKFKYYALFLGYEKRNGNVMSGEWKTNFKKWVATINSFFQKRGISPNRVLIYPYDEPTSGLVSTIDDMADWFQKVGIKNPLYVTVGGSGRFESVKLVKSVEYVQVALKLAGKANKTKGNNTKIFSYAVMGQSRLNNPSRYLKLAIRAFDEGLAGIGVWNYSDMRRAVNKNSMMAFNNGKPSWELNLTKYKKDYSLIYATKERIYSSLRWEALSYGIDAFYYLQLYKEKYGIKKSKMLSQNLLEDRIDYQKWESIKLDLLLNR